MIANVPLSLNKKSSSFYYVETKTFIEIAGGQKIGNTRNPYYLVSHPSNTSSRARNFGQKLLPWVWCHKWEHKHLSMYKEVFFDLLPLYSKCYKYAPGHDISYFHKSNCTSTDKFSKWDEIQSKLFYFHSQKWRRTAPRIPVPNTVLQKSTKIYQLPLLIPGNWAKKL